MGTGSLKLSNLGKNLKFLKEKETTGKFPGTENSTKQKDADSHSLKTPLGGDTYPSALLKVDESSLW